MHTRTRLITSLLPAVLLAACTGPGPAATPPTPAASPAPASLAPVEPVTPRPTLDPADDPAPVLVSVAFNTSGGCGQVEPGCPPLRVVTDVAELDAQFARALAAADLDALAAFDGQTDTGCGDAFVDGVSLMARLSVTSGDEVRRVVFCLADADRQVAGVPELWALYDSPQAVVPETVRVRFEEVGGCQLADTCRPPIAVEPAFLSPRLHHLLLEADPDELAKAQVDDGSCGEAPVDGRGIVAEVTWERHDDRVVRACISGPAQGSAPGQALAELYELVAD